MKQFLHFLILLLCLSIASYASEKEGQDTARYKCTYSMQYMNDTLKMSYGNKDWFIVQIGDNITKGYSYSDFHMDSLIHSPGGPQKLAGIYMKSHESAMSVFGTNLMYAKIYKDHSKKTITVSDHISINAFVYEEELKPQDWKISEDTMSMVGYKCQKATCNFRGRNYVAWFAPDIPISEGPWKFGGLPGLIMKIEDTQHHYIFELKSFQKVNEVIKIDNNQKATKIERRQFLSYLMGGKADELTEMDFAKLNLSVPPQKKNYDYIERDYK